MKRFFWLFIIACLFFYGFSVTAFAANGAYGWYCVHVAEHRQPQIAPELAFAEEEGAVFLDRRHTAYDGEDKVIYLTFDAGYENGNVARILDVLREENVPAAFFVLANLVNKNTELLRRMAEEGHLICNHTVHHKDMSGMTDEEMLRELRELEQLCAEKAGVEMTKFYRPPEGRFSKQNLLCASKNGYTPVFWSFAYADWDNKKQMSTDAAKEIILNNLHNGEVMLLHPTSATNAKILGEVIRAMKQEGFRFASLNELIAQEGGSCTKEGQ